MSSSKRTFLSIFFSASLVPVFAFGENDLFNQVKNPRGSWLRDIQQKIQKKVAFAPVLFFGRGIFQYTFGFLPHRRPVNVVGKSLVPKQYLGIMIFLFYEVIGTSNNDRECFMLCLLAKIPLLGLKN